MNKPPGLEIKLTQLQEMQMNTPKPDVVFQQKPWSENSNEIWLGSTLKFYRNIEKFHFPSKLDSETRKQILSLIQNHLVSSPDLKESFFLEAESLSPRSKEYLFEHYLAQEGFQQAYNGEGFVVDNTGSFFAILNIKNHIQLELIDTEGSLEKTWEKLIKIETHLGKPLHYAYSNSFGFLTSDPNQSGTGFTVHAFLNLSALTHLGKLEEELNKYKHLNLNITGLQGDPEYFIGDIVNLYNKYTIGITEGDIINSIQSAVTKLTVTERGLRNQIKQEPSHEIQDKISRAYALLKCAHQLETIETLNAISLCKLAIDLNWLTGISHKELNTLFFNCRRAHLSHTLNLDYKDEELSLKRAQYIKNILKNTTFQKVNP
jgi:protein arginine kinase